MRLILEKHLLDPLDGAFKPGAILVRDLEATNTEPQRGLLVGRELYGSLFVVGFGINGSFDGQQ